MNKISFKIKKWTPDGAYYDENRNKWVGPDYKEKQSIELIKKKRRTTPKTKTDKPTNWTANGWYYDDKSEKWIGPDYETEAEKKEKEERISRYYERRRAEGKGPTYEEWKAEREEEEKYKSRRK